MGQIDWSTPPTESEIAVGFDTSPTEQEMVGFNQQEQSMFGGDMLNVIDGQKVQTGIPTDIITIPQDVTATNTSFGNEGGIEGNLDLSQTISANQIIGNPTAVDPRTNETFNIAGIGAEPTYLGMDLVNPVVKGLGAIGAGYAGYKGAQAVKNKIFPVGGEAEAVGKFRGLDLDGVENITAGVPREDKAFSLAMGGGTDTVGVVSAAVKSGGDRAARALKKDMGKRIEKIDSITGSKDIKEVSKETAHMYSKMVETVAKGNDSVYDGTTLIDGLNQLEKLGARSEASERTVNVLKNKLESNPNITIEQALDYRKDINYELRTAKGDSVRIWQGLKDNIDKFISTNTDPKLSKFIDDAVDTYANTKNNEELIEIINKNKTSDGNAVDWDKANKAIEAAGLKSKETSEALSITKEFADKFGNDSRLSKLTVTKGSPESANGVFTLFSKAVKTVVNLGEKAIRTDSAINREVQANILSSIIKKSKTENEFMVNVIKNKNVSKDIRDLLAKHLKDTKRLHKTTFGEVATNKVNKDVERNLLKSRRDRNTAQNTMDKAQDNIDMIDDSISDIDNKIEIAIEKGKATSALRERKARLEKRLVRAERDLEVKTDKHSELSGKYDKEVLDSGYSVDETGRFKVPTKAEPRGNVSIPKKELP